MKQDRTRLQKELEAEAKRDLTRAFETLWQQLGGPELETEYAFHPERGFKFDYYHRPTQTGIEIEGGTFSGGSHTRGKGYSKDCHKYNLAQLLGHRVFRFTTDMINGNDPAKHLEPVIEAIKERAL